jgi:thioredoxin 1
MMLTDKNFETEVLKADVPVLVEFWGSWCPPCQVEKKILKKLEEEYAKRIKIGTLNINRNPRTTLKYDIKGVPTYIIFHKGKIIHRDIAAKSEKQLRKMIEEALEKTTLT